MKKSNIILGVLLALLLVLAVGCGDKETETTDDQLTSVPAEPVPEEEVTAGGEDVTVEPPAEPVPEEEAAPAEVPAEEPVEAIEEVNETPEESGNTDTLRIITLKDLNVYPDDLKIKVGTTVEWRNVNDNFQHIIGWNGQKQMGVKPEPIKTGESWSYTFETPGVIKWFSTARPTIQGVITVEE